MTADDADLVQALLDRHDGQTLMLLTDSQIADRPRALALAQRVGLAQLNAAELARFSRVPLWEIPRDIVRGINRLREEGLSSIIVTAGDAGVFAFVRDRWWYAAPHVVPTVNDVGAGDTLAGAVLAGLARNMEFDEVLRAAAAAAALHVSGQDRAGGWDQLEAFRAGTPTRPFTKKRVARPFVNDRHVAKLVRPLAYVAAGVLTTVAAVSLWR
jgi:fructose-1-phosphate kinase PfkB-like protein